MSDPPSRWNKESKHGAGLQLDRVPATQRARDEYRRSIWTLVVSEHEDVQRYATLLLAAEGVSATTCRNRAEALELFEKIRPSLVVMDMDTKTADSLAQVFRVTSVDGAVPVILITGPGERETAIKGVELGAYDFVEKPLDPRLLGFALRRAIAHVRSVREQEEHKRILEETVEERTSIVREKDFLQGILDSSTLVSVILTDLEQNVLFWNTGAQNIFGYAADEILGEKITKIYPADSLTVETVEKLREMVAKKAGTVHGKMKQVTKDGRTVITSLALSPMLKPSGRLQGILGVGLDVTEEVHLHEELVRSYAQIKMIQDVSMFSLAKLAESRDEETGHHLNRIQEYCRSLASRMARRDAYQQIMTHEYIEDLVRSSVLHDIGKVGIPDAILLSTGRYTPEEYEIMKRHPIIGGEALAEAARELGQESYLCMARDIAYYHHERWDGRGYPRGLKEEQIPLPARVVAIADVYDALTSQRRYKRAFSHKEAVTLIKAEGGEHFDPDLVDVFNEADEDFGTIRQKFSEAGVIADE
jgi:PAS domain S-box-containing protein